MSPRYDVRPGSPDAPTLTLVVNPAAGRGRARRKLPAVLGELRRGLPHAGLRVIEARDYAEARLWCTLAVQNAKAPQEDRRSDALVVMGGDGMMHLGINASAGTAIPLGLIPAGSGNDFCRGIGLPRQAEAAVGTIVEGSTQRIDLTEVRGRLAGGAERRWVGSIVSTGFDGRVNQRANALAWPIGGLSYAYAALAELRSFEPLTYRLQIDGHPREESAMFVAVGNAGLFGGGMRGCPNADVTDGELDLTIVHPVSRATLLRLLPAMYSGAFVRDPAVELIRAREVVVDGDGLYGMADGEDLGPVPLHLRAVPDVLAVYAPAH